MARALVALLLDLLLSECDPPLFKLAASTTPPIPVRERLDFVCALGRVILYYRQIEIMQIVARPIPVRQLNKYLLLLLACVLP